MSIDEPPASIAEPATPEDGSPTPSTPSRWNPHDVLALVKNHKPVVAAAIIVAGLLALFALTPGRDPVWDAQGYWLYQRQFTGLFGFTTYTEELRGYGFPWFLRLVATVSGPLGSNPSHVARLISLCIVPALFCWTVPGLARSFSKRTVVTIPRMVGMSIVFVAFWRNDLFYVLSDLPALFALATGVMLLVRYDTARATAGAGLLLAAATNFRPAYLGAYAACVGLMFLLDRGWFRIAVRTAILVLAFVVMSIPQVIANRANHQSTSPVSTQASKLSLLQLSLGTQLTRYDTYIGTTLTDGRQNFLWIEGSSFSETSKLSFKSIPEFLSWSAKNPVLTAKMTGWHLFNGNDLRMAGTFVDDVDLRTPGVLVKGDDLRNRPLQVANYLLIASAFGVLVASRLTRPAPKGKTRIARLRHPPTFIALVLAAACLPALTGAVETRFFLPLHVAMLATVFLGASPQMLPENRKARGGILVAMAGLIAILFWFGVQSEAQLFA